MDSWHAARVFLAHYFAAICHQRISLSGATLLLRHCVNHTQQKQGNGGRVREGGEEKCEISFGGWGGAEELGTAIALGER